MQGHTLAEAREAASDGVNVYWHRTLGPEWWGAEMGKPRGPHRRLTWSDDNTSVGVCQVTAHRWAIEGCEHGENGGPCEWCRSCPHIEGPGPDWSAYVWFELDHKLGTLSALVPIWAFGTLEHMRMRVEELPTAPIAGFEVVRFVRAREDGYDLMDAPWEPAGRLSFLENHENSFIDRRSVEEFLDELDAEYIVATHVIMRRV